MNGNVAYKLNRPWRKKALCRLSGHTWRFYVDRQNSYTGYLERCTRCGEIKQIPQ